MPSKYTAYEPDAIDCEKLTRALAEDFSVIPMLETLYTREQVVVVCRTRAMGGLADGEIKCQSLVKGPVRSARSLYTMQYSALLDCWHQHDRGVLAAAERPITRGWDGRPQTPRRRT